MEKIVVRTSKPKLPPVPLIKAVEKIRKGFSLLTKKMVPPPVALLELVTGTWVSQTVCTLAELGVADEMDNSTPVSAQTIAQKLDLHPEALYRLMRAASVVGIFSETQDMKFTLTSMGKCLRSDHPQSMRYMAMFTGRINWKNWEALPYAAKTGKCAAEKVLGEKPFDWLSKNKAEADIFDKAMTNISSMEMDAILGAYDFSKFQTIADVGGGYGVFLSWILMTHPRLKGMLYDMPHVTKGAKSYINSAKLSDRIEIQSGSFFESVPAGADCYMMKHIIHDWSDAESIKILKNIRQQIPANGKLLLFEAVIQGPNVPDFAKFLDIEMLVVTTGKERTEAGYSDLLKQAGFKLDRIVPTISLAQVIEASPV